MPSTQSDKKRLSWIDFSRGIAFLMVIYSHIPTCTPDIMHFFAPVFLTTFFFVSGYLFKSGQGISYVLEHRIRTLLIPFLILGIVMIFMSQLMTFNEHVDIKDALVGLIAQNGQNQILWFIAALFVYSVIFYFVDKLCKTPLMLLCVATGLFIFNSITFNWLKIKQIPWHLDTFGFACFYMALGRLYRLHETRIDKYLTTPVLLIVTAIYTVALFILPYYISFMGSKWIIDSMIITTIGLVIIISLSKKIGSKSKLILFVGANTLFYFAFHGKVYSMMFTVIGKKFPALLEIDDILISIFIVIIDAIIMIIPAITVNRFMPKIMGKGYKLWNTDSNTDKKATTTIKDA